MCGDGICDSPHEYSGFGRFGCIKDCDRFLNTTRIYVELEDFVKATSKVWDISKAGPILTRAQPGFKWNIWSYTMQDFVLAEDSDLTSVDVEVPDGRLELRLYQTGIVSEAIDK